MDDFPIITKEERLAQGLVVGMPVKIKGKPLMVRCDDDLVQRNKLGEVAVFIGYFSYHQTGVRDLWSQRVMAEYSKNRIARWTP